MHREHASRSGATPEHPEDSAHPGHGSAGTPACGCGADGRKAVSVDPAIRDRSLNRLRRIEGQVRGLQRMVEEERYCADVLVQIGAVHEALRAVARELLHNHLEHCASAAIARGGEEAKAMYAELVELAFKHAR